MIISLCGFMGSGKSTVGKKLASKLGYSYIDLDSEIEEREGRSIPEIFATDGEQTFRRIESDIIRQYKCAWISGSDNIVLSLGGGAVVPIENRDTIRQFSRLVYLNVPFNVCYARIKDSDRPIVRKKSKAELKAVYDSRLAAYLDCDVSVDGKRNTGKVVDEIIILLGLEGKV